ncbi:MAG: ThiF family adenylyltransferase [Anaerolineaceae bacterium]|nr:ThiF family adenylyltransferase [Anaerolineaceae bacterium]
MTMDWTRVEQLFGSENLRFLAQKKVGVVGCGSGGSFVALSLAMSGIGHFTLIDSDVLEPGNIVRHACDMRYIGQNKAVAVADLIRYRNPKATVEVREGRVEAHMDALDDLDILVVGVDGENVKYIINEAVLKRGLTAVYAGVYERGEGGDVVIIRPYNGPCYACWAEELREGARTPKPGETELDYGMIGESGTLEAEPGLWIHVTKVASIQTDLILNELLRGTDLHNDMPGNTIIIANRELEILDGVTNQPHTAVWVDIPRDPDCLVCGDKLRLNDEARQTMSLDDLDTSIVFEEDEGEAG